MTRSADFARVVKRGVRAPQPDLVVHACRDVDEDVEGPQAAAPRVGFIVSKSVGGAVDRNTVVRRLRHLMRTLLDDLDGSDRIVVRALSGSRGADSLRLRRQLESGVRRARDLMDRPR